jgi:hypothetical protein
MEGGAKTKAQSNPNPRKATFGMKALNAALDNIMGMDTGIKRQRRVIVQPARAPSERAKAVAAKKAETKVTSVSTKPKSASKPKPASKPKAAPKKILPVVKEEEDEPVRRQPTRIPFDDDRIVNRNLSDVIEYKHKEEYVNAFTDLFEKHIPHLKSFIHEHAMNKMEAPGDIGLTIVELTDDLYFTIRDKLLKKVRSSGF